VRAVVIGATGAHGRRVASELLRSQELTGLLLVARSPDPLEQLASHLGGARRNVAYVAAAAAGDVLSGNDVVICCSSSEQAAWVEAAITARVACVTLADDPAEWKQVADLDRSARANGVTVAAGCGFSPGITNLMAVLAGEELERVESLALTVARSLGDTDGTSSALELLELFAGASGPPNGPPTDDPGHLPRLVYLPEPIAWIETFRAGHPETISLPRRLPDLRSLEYRIGLTERVGTDIARVAAALGLARSRLGRRLWLRIAASGRPLLGLLAVGAGAWSGARVDAKGERDGRPASVTIGIVDHLSNLVPLMAVRAALQLGTGAVAQPGVHSTEQLFDARSTLAALADRGIRIARLEAEPV
jgi:hypothetical protein